MIATFHAATRSLARLKGCQRGTSFVEFALILPIFLLLVLGGSTLFIYHRAIHDIERATSAIVDVITRDVVIDQNRREFIVKSASALLGRYYDPDTIDLTVTSMLAKDSGERRSDEFEVAWSFRGDGGGSSDDDAPPTPRLPAIYPGSTLILVSLRARVQLPLGRYIGAGSFLGEAIAIRKPRYSATIEWIDR